MTRISQWQSSQLYTPFLTLFLIALPAFGQVGYIVTVAMIIVHHWLRKSTREELGIGQPKSWTRTILISILLAVLMLLFFAVVNPIILQLFPDAPKDLSRFDQLKGNEGMLILSLISVWALAAFGEEIIWRGFVMKHVAEFFGGKRVAWVLSLLITSLIFGLAHFYQGPIGIIQTGLAGLFLGAVFMINGKRSLWINIIMHGLIDTLSMVSFYLGAVDYT